MTPTPLGREMRAWRKEQGLSANAASERADISCKLWLDLEYGKSGSGIRGGTLRRIAAVLGLTFTEAAQLFYNTEIYTGG